MTRIKLIVATTLMLATGTAHASYAQPGQINTLTVLANGSLLFNQDGPRGALVGCAADLPNRWAIDGTTAIGQVKVAHILTAYALHKQISVVGTDTCDVWPDTETVNYVVIND